MKVQYYISNKFCKFYLPFLLYRGCLTKVIEKVYNISIEYI